MGKYDYNKKSFETFRKAVTSAGTAEKLHTDLPIPDGMMLIIKALDANTDLVRYANSQPKAQSTDAFTLKAGQSVGLRITNCNLVWLDAIVSGEAVVCSVEVF